MGVFFIILGALKPLFLEFWGLYNKEYSLLKCHKNANFLSIFGRWVEDYLLYWTGIKPWH